MIDSIYVALSGMGAHERGLNVISNNVANMNTPGFRRSSVGFAEVLNQGGGRPGSGPQLGGQPAFGGGVDASRTYLDMGVGERQETGRDMDLRLDGEGFFVLRDESGALRYTRAGQFTFDDGALYFDREKRVAVATRDATGALIPFNVKNLRPNTETDAQPTSKVALDGVLSLADEDKKAEVSSLTVFDSKGVAHTLTLKFTLDTTGPGGVQLARWNMSVMEGTEEIGNAVFETASASTPLTIDLKLKDANVLTVAFSFDGSMGQLGSSSNLAVKSVDGHAAVTITGSRFDEAGTLKLTYSDGKSLDGPRLLLARIDNADRLSALGNALFECRDEEHVVLREAGPGLRIVSRELELSNVELTGQFSQLILMQRGYQASSQVLSTANDMMQDLMDLRGRK